jgi:Autographiviridae portal protein
MNDQIKSNAPPPEDPVTLPSVESRYEILSTYRIPYLNRAFDCAELTIPHLLPRYGHSSTTVLPTPFQSVGARGVNHLSSKLLISLFPPNTPIFKMMMDEGIIAQMEAEHGGEESAETKNLRTEFDKAFGKIERIVMSEVEASGDRTVLSEALKHLLVVGNSLLHQAKEGLRAFPLNQFVVRRDPAGNVLEIILKEEVDPIVLPLVIRQAITSSSKAYSDKKSVPLFTYVCRKETEWVTYQEVNGTIIEKTRGSYPLDRNPWIPLRFNRINGEDYGRGYVEEYIGDFTSLENLTAAIVQGAAAASKVLFLVKPNSTTKVKVLSKTPNGGFASGNAEDVTVLRLDKAQDFATAKALRDDFISQLSYAFLLNTAIQREAERVTAEEIRFMAEELEQTLGGFYSIMSIELQLPYIQVKMDGLQRKGKLPKLPKGSVRPTIVTGLEALGRGNDRNKLVRYLQTVAAAVGPEALAMYVNVSEVFSRLAIADGIDTKNLIKTEDQVAQAQQQQQMMALVEKLGPNVTNAMGGAAKERIKNEQAGAQQPASGGSPTASGPQAA